MVFGLQGIVMMFAEAEDNMCTQSCTWHCWYWSSENGTQFTLSGDGCRYLPAISSAALKIVIHSLNAKARTCYSQSHESELSVPPWGFEQIGWCKLDTERMFVVTGLLKFCELRHDAGIRLCFLIRCWFLLLIWNSAGPSYARAYSLPILWSGFQHTWNRTCKFQMPLMKMLKCV